MSEQNTDREHLLNSVGRYYTSKLEQFGATARGVDWNSTESQELRFSQLLRVCERQNNFTIVDYGCGYGALANTLVKERIPFRRYAGYDVSSAMIASARNLLAGEPRCDFVDQDSLIPIADYTIASGIFNVKQHFDVPEWARYVRDTISRLASLSRGGFAFNMLTKYSDADRMRADLYYGDPHEYFDYCRENFSRRVALLHDYPLYEFTIIVRTV